MLQLIALSIADRQLLRGHGQNLIMRLLGDACQKLRCVTTHFRIWIAPKQFGDMGQIITETDQVGADFCLV